MIDSPDGALQLLSYSVQCGSRSLLVAAAGCERAHKVIHILPVKEVHVYTKVCVFSPIDTHTACIISHAHGSSTCDYKYLKYTQHKKILSEKGSTL